MRFFSRVDKIVSTLDSLGGPKSEGDENRKLVRVLTAYYEMEQRTLLYRDEVSRAEIREHCPTEPPETSRVKGEERGPGTVFEWTHPRWARRWSWG